MMLLQSMDCFLECVVVSALTRPKLPKTMLAGSATTAVSGAPA